MRHEFIARAQRHQRVVQKCSAQVKKTEAVLDFQADKPPVGHQKTRRPTPNGAAIYWGWLGRLGLRRFSVKRSPKLD